MRPPFYPLNQASIGLLILLLFTALTFQSHAQSGSVTTTQSFSYTGQIVTWTVPTGVNSLTIEARGAEGGDVINRRFAAGKGAIVSAIVSVSPGQSLSILVGQQLSGRSAGGGGSFVVAPSGTIVPTPLVIAGGGAGASSDFNSNVTQDSDTKHGQAGPSGGTGSNGTAGGTDGLGGSGSNSGGGGGLLSNGGGINGFPNAGGRAFVNGGAGGSGGSSGSFGGGGGINTNSNGSSGGGGGYSGGGGGGIGGGGGSFTVGTRLAARTGATEGNSGNGLVIISYSIQTIRYVKQGGSGTGDGTSWANASGDLQSQIDIAGAQQVWVAGGRYTRTGGGAFALKNGVAVYGGFVGSENSLTDRPGVNPVNGQPSSTTLTTASRSAVINTSDLDNTARLDGVVITGGNNNFGGGIYNSNSSPVLTNCTISGNTATQLGGGLFNTRSSPVLTNCLISGNSVSNLGGGIYNDSSSPVLTNCFIRSNTASRQGGGLFNNSSSSPSLTNCTISGNTASDQGGGILNKANSSPVLTNCLLANNTATNQGGAIHNFDGSNPRLVNCTLSGNSAGDQGGAISEDGTTSQLINAILFNNGGTKAFRFINNGSTSLTYSLIESGATGYTSSPTNQTATVSPFVSGSDFQLTACSVAIDAGSNAAYTGPATDLAGNTRLVRQIDMGAYEFQGTPNSSVAITQQPVSGSSVTAGAAVSVPVSVSGTVNGYQWYKDNLSSPVTGQTSATLTLSNVQPGQKGSYSLVVTGTCNSVTSTAFSLSVSAPAQPIRYVKQGGSGTGDGTSWTNASGDLQSQIDIAGAQQVWVAGGRYTTTANGGSFSLKNGVAVYGGFTGSETSLGARPGVNPVGGQPSSTTLTNPSGSVVYNTSLDNTARLDGVVITGGNRSLAGGGVLNNISSPVLTNCVISGNSANQGGGISNAGGSPSLINCVISGNSTTAKGGGIYNNSSNPSLTNCVVSGNTAQEGGGMFNNGGSPSLTNCVISGNMATAQGGAFGSSTSGNPILTGCTLTGNQAPSGAAFSNVGSTPRLTNTILWNNQNQNAIVNFGQSGLVATYCLIEAGETDFTGSNNLVATTSPFVSSTDFQLTACSVAIDAGDPNSTTAISGATDLAGNPRFYQNGRIDMGAYEFQGTPNQPIAITQQPVSGSSVQAGASVSVPVSVSGTVSGYQWYKDNLSSPVTGQTSATLTLSNVQPGQTGSYSLVVTGACNSVTTTAFSLSVSASAQPIRYVKQGGTGDGTSWANASGDLQSQIDIAGAQQVWVAGGRYTTTANSGSFVMKNGVAVYGGFRGGEQNLTDRPGGNPVGGQPSSTTLTTTSTTQAVINNNGNTLTNSAVLDGFVITGGNNAPNGRGKGGGMYNLNGSPTLVNLRFSQNQAQFGGGLFNEVSSPALSNCDFSQNQSTVQGGGIYNDRSSPAITSVRFSQNTSDTGGGLFNDQSSPSLTNCSFSQNQASNVGGGIYNLGGSSPRLVNCTFTANRAILGAALINYDGSQPVLTNTILFDNQESAGTSINNNAGTGVTANYCLIGQGENDFTGTNNQVATVSPFVSGSDFQLTACSVAIDAGDNGAYSAAGGPATDLAGNPRPVRQIDLGAYEFQGTPNASVAITRQPASGSSVQSGASVRVPVSVSGTVSGYQWYKDNLGSPVSGQTSATLTLTNVQPGQTGSYSLVVTGACNSVTSTAFSLTVSAPAQPIRYVKPVATGRGDGTSWDNASGDLQSQINIAGAQQVWVAGGRYTRTGGGSFSLKSGVAVYGGFAGNENSLGDRPGVNPVVGSISSTTLTAGSGGGSVIANSGVSNTARLDGVVITGGSSTDFGGGISNQSSSPVLMNCLISGNVTDRNGGGISNIGGIPILINCVISNNSANLGGGIYNDSSSPVLTNCVIRGNSADNSGGGIINESRSSPTLTNCVLSSNTANYGGGIYSGGSSRPNLRGCTLTGNRAGVGAALVNYSSSQPVLTNTILWDNQESANTAIDNDTGTDVTANYCLIGQGESSFTGSNNLVATTSPFVSGSDFQLTVCSVAIDAGNPNSTSNTSGSTDLVGNPRFYQSGRIDIGAFEFQGTPSSSVAITQQPVSGSSVCVGSTVTAMVLVSGTISSYQWYRDGQPVVGQNSATLSLTNVQPASAGSYSVVVTGSCNSVTSTAFSLTVNALPTASLTNNGPISCSATSVTLTASGGSAYQFSNGASQINNGPTATVSSAGIYSVTVISGNGCTATTSTTVTGDVSMPTAGLTNNGPISCSATSVTLTASGGSTYRFSSGANQIGNGPTATVTSAGVYSVTVVGTNGCSSVASTTVTGDQNVPMASLTNNGPISCSMTNVTLTASGGSTYRFSAGANQISNGSTATVSTAGVHSVTVASSNGCSSVASTTVTGDQSVPVAGLTNSGPISCSMTSVTLTASGGNTYRFSSGASQVNNGPTATVSSAGVYSVTVISGNGCTATASTTVAGDVSVPTAGLTNNGPISCSMTSVTLTASGESTYRFSNGANQINGGNTATVSSAGVYSVTVVGSNGCSSVASTTVAGDQSVPTASLTNNGPISCSVTSVTLTALGGSTYRFSSGAAQIGNGPTATVNSAGVYSVTVVSSNGCSAVASTTVVGDQSVPVANLTNNGPISCSMTSVTLTASGGNLYRFSSGANQIGSGPTATVSTAGVYSVTVMSVNGCSSVASTTVVGDQSVPTASLTNNGPISCSMTSVTLTASGGSMYRFSNGAGQVNNGPTATASSAGIYSVTVVSSNGCSSVASTTVTGDQSVPVASLTNNGPISCSMTSVTLTASGGNTYRFSNGANQIGNSPTATVSTAGVYSVTVVGSNGCTATASTTVVGDQSVPTASLTNNGPISCSMTSVTLTASGGSTYRFSSGANQINGGNTATASSAGVYSVTVISANGCTATASTTVTGDVGAPVAGLTNNGPISCLMTSVTLTASGGNTYRFSSGASQVNNGPTATVSSAGVYSVTVVSANGCSSVAQTTVTGDQSVPMANLINNGPISCSVTFVTLTASGGSTYRFSNGANQINGGNTATVSSAGVYSVTVVGSNGCSSVASTTVAGDQSVPTASLTNNGPVSCSMTSVTLTASGGSTYRFSSGVSQVNNGPTATVTTAGVYSVTVISTNGCTATASTTVAGDQSIPVAGLTNNSPLSCSMTTVSLTASGGGSYQFSAGVNQIGNGPTATVSSAGVYSVTVISGNGCTAAASTTVTGDVSVPVVSIQATPSLTITQGQSTLLTASATGSQPLTYSWSNSQTTPAISVSTAGPYSVTVVGANGCSATASVVVSVTAAPVVSGPFAITGVSLVSCTPINEFRKVISIQPLYDGLDGSPVSFSVANELRATTDPGPYTLQLYVDNPTITLRAVQSGVLTSFVYNWLVACNSGVTPPPSVTNTAPTLVSPVNDQTATAGGYFSLNLAGVFTDAQTPNGLVLSASGLLAGLSLSGTTLSGILSMSGVSGITITATDPGSLSVSTSFTLTVLPAPAGNTAPTVVSPVSNQTALVGQVFTLLVAGVFTDAETPNALTLSAGGLPAGLNLTGTTISGTPSTTGTTTVTLTATDAGNLSTNTRFVFTVTAPTSPTNTGSFAIVGVSTISCTPIVAGRIDISFNPQYTGLNGNPVTFSVANELAPTTAGGPYSLQLYVDNPTITLQAMQSGVGSSFAYNWLAACQSGSNPTPTPGNTAPRVIQVVSPQSATVSQGYTLSITNVFTDSETPTGLVLSASGLPAGLSLTGTTISGTPSLSGTATVVLTATDPGSLSATTSFVLTVSPAASVTTSPPSAGFSITGVQTLSCVTVGTGQRSVTFVPQYAGLNGQAITFSVLNELAPTTAGGPYTLRLYTDNPSISLKATQAGSVGEASFSYNWLAACNSGNTRRAAEPVAAWQVVVLGNPVVGETVEVEVRGAVGESLRLETLSEQGYRVDRQGVESARVVERFTLRVGTSAGVYLLRVSSVTQSQTLKLLKK